MISSCPSPCSLGRGWGRVGFPMPLGMSLDLGKKLYWRRSNEAVSICPSPALLPGAIRACSCCLGEAPCPMGEAAELVLLLCLAALAGRGAGELFPSGSEVLESPRVLCRSAGLGACCRLLPAVKELLVLAGTASCFSRSHSSP